MIRPTIPTRRDALPRAATVAIFAYVAASIAVLALMWKYPGAYADLMMWWAK